MKIPQEFSRRASGVLVTAALLTGLVGGQVVGAVAGPTNTTIRIQPGDQVTVIAEAAIASPSASLVPTPTPTAVPTPTPTPTPTPPPSLPAGTVVTPTQSITTLLQQGKRDFLLRAGVHKFSLGSAQTSYKNVSISSYPGEKAVIDGQGVESLVYLGPNSGTWKLADLEIRNFLPEDQGVIGIGDSTRIEMTRVKIVGSGIPSGNNDHGVYFHGTGTGLLIDPDITNFPGSALQTYRGTPSVEVRGGKLHSMYVGVFAYSGSLNFIGVDIRGAGVWDIDNQLPATVTMSGCTGRGGNGQPKITTHS